MFLALLKKILITFFRTIIYFLYSIYNPIPLFILISLFIFLSENKIQIYSHIVFLSIIETCPIFLIKGFFQQ